MQKTILIVSGGVEAADAAKRAREMGLYVVVSDRDPHAPGFAFADSVLLADVYAPDETAAAAERYARKLRKIDGVICVAADAPMTVAAVNKRLGLPGISVESARLLQEMAEQLQALTAAEQELQRRLQLALVAAGIAAAVVAAALIFAIVS